VLGVGSLGEEQLEVHHVHMKKFHSVVAFLQGAYQEEDNSCLVVVEACTVDSQHNLGPQEEGLVDDPRVRVEEDPMAVEGA
jgi:hypothetical protein